MKKRNTQTERISGRFGAALALTALLLALFAGSLTAQNPYPDYDFKAVNPDGDTLYYRITSSTAPYTVAVTRCHDSVYHTLPWPQHWFEVETPGFVYPVYDYDTLITIPSSVTYGGHTYTVTAIDKEAFYFQRGIHTVILPASVETIDSGAFCKSSLHQIVMSPNVSSINYYAFEYTPLSSIELPSGLTHIGKEAFAFSSITQVDIPAGVTLLPEMAFVRCPLTKITFHEGLQEIQERAFSAMYIDSLIFPRSLRKIALESIVPIAWETGDDLVIWNDTSQCRYVEFLSGPNPLELADYCFYNFKDLETLILSDNIIRIGSYGFASSGLQQVVIPPLIDTIAEGCFYECPFLSNAELPNELKVIDRLAFAGTPMLKEISIPASVTSIGNRAFYFYGTEGGLEVINLYGETPPTIHSGSGYPTFSMWDTIYVRVPCGKTLVYQSAPVWSDYSNFVYEECVGVEEREPAEFKVYPNPTDDVLFIELRGGTGIANMALYDLQGRVVGTRFIASATGTSATVNMRDIPAGVYVLRVTDMDGKEYHQKIVRK